MSHIVALGDFTVDATPGSSHSALVNAGGGTLDLPIQLLRAEDFPDAVDLEVAADPPLDVTLADTQLTGQDAVATTMEASVPPATPSGTYKITVTATDGTRERTSTFPLTVDSVTPTAAAPGLAVRSGGVLGDGVATRATWSPATDPGGSISRYQVRWRVDGSLDRQRIWVVQPQRRAPDGSRPHVCPAGAGPGCGRKLERLGRERRGRAGPLAGHEPLARPRRRLEAREPVVGIRWNGAQGPVKGPSVTRPFTGSAIAWIGAKGAKRGGPPSTSTACASRPLTCGGRRSCTRPLSGPDRGPTSGSHELRIKVLGTRHRHRVDVDAFVIVR